MRGMLLAVLAAGCAAPRELPLRDLEKSDERFVAPAPDDGAARMDALLKKDELTLQEVLEIADRLNPELALERKNVDLAAAAIWEAKLYPNPSLLIEVEDYRTRDGATLGKMERAAGLAFPIVYSGRIGDAIDLAEKEREIAAVRYVWRRREILTGLKRAFVTLLAARRNAELARETRDIAKTFHDVIQVRFDAKAAPEMELLKAAVNLAKADVDLKLSEKDAAVSLKALHALMGDVDFPKDKFAGELVTRFTVPSFEALRGQVTTAHPLLEEAAREKEAAERELSLAKSERWPDVELEFTVGKDAEDDTILEGGLSIPLPFFNRNQGKILKAEIRIRQAQLKIQSVRNRLVLDFTGAYRNFVAAQDRVTIYGEEILPKAGAALKQTDEGYKLGRFTYLDLLDAQRTLAEAKVAHAAALADLNLAAADLEKLTGTKLEPIR